MEPLKVVKGIKEVEEGGWKELGFKDKKAWKNDPIALLLVSYFIGKY